MARNHELKWLEKDMTLNDLREISEECRIRIHTKLRKLVPRGTYRELESDLDKLLTEHYLEGRMLAEEDKSM